ncbi:MAG: hypothetical protein V2A78_07745 [bacterium]
MFRFFGLFTLIPATVLLTISFFVLFTRTRVDSPGLKKFGMLAATLLWVSAGLILLAGLYILVTGHHPLFNMMNETSKLCPLCK